MFKSHLKGFIFRALSPLCLFWVMYKLDGMLLEQIIAVMGVGICIVILGFIAEFGIKDATAN